MHQAFLTFTPRIKSKLEKSFDRFHAENPHVYDALREVCLEMRETLKHWEINGAFVLVRYNHIKTTGEDFKMNNSYRAFYARMLMAREPKLEGFFKTRTSRADEMEVK